MIRIVLVLLLFAVPLNAAPIGNKNADGSCTYYYITPKAMSSSWITFKHYRLDGTRNGMPWLSNEATTTMNGGFYNINLRQYTSSGGGWTNVGGAYNIIPENVANWDAKLAPYGLSTNSSFNPVTYFLSNPWDPTCGVLPTCEDKFNEAVAECGGNAEQVQVVNGSPDPSECHYECSPCLDQENGFYPVTHYVDECGVGNFTYDYDTCLGECTTVPCAQEKKDLVTLCGGLEYVGSFDESTCSGECVPCYKQRQVADKNCGPNSYTIDNGTCVYECKNCDQMQAACTAQCGANGIYSFKCESDFLTGVNTGDCDCVDALLYPDGETFDPTMYDIDGVGEVLNDSSITKNDDGTYTAVYDQYIKNQDGSYTINNTVKNYSSTGDVISTVTTSTRTTSVPAALQDPAGEPTEPEPGEPYEYTPEEIEVTFTPLTEAYSQFETKFPVTVVSGLVSMLSDLEVPAAAPVITSGETGYGKVEIDLSWMDPVMAFVRLLFKVALSFGSALLILRMWSN